MWVMENSVIPVGVDAPDANYRFAGNLKFRVFGLKEETEYTVYQDGKEQMRFTARRINGKPEVITPLEGCLVEWIDG